MRNCNFVVLDLETTGLAPKEDRILEIGAVKVLDGQIAERYETFVDPRRKIPPRITELTGIRDEMVIGAPKSDAAVAGFVEFCGDLPLIGHNIMFDYSFVKHNAVNQGISFEKEACDTLQIARKALPQLESRSLEALCRHYGILREHAHRAMDDVLETLELYQRLEEEFFAEHPEWFQMTPLVLKVKREHPITPAQKKYLRDLMEYHQLSLEVEMESLTRSEASRLIDRLILANGRIQNRRSRKE